MRAVLYAHDLEPITVIEITEWMVQMLRRERHISLHVIEPLSTTVPWPEAKNLSVEMKTVQITAELIRRGQHESLLLFTENEASALMLRSTFLPGQQSRVLQIKEDAFRRGYWSATLGFGD